MSKKTAVKKECLIRRAKGRVELNPKGRAWASARRVSIDVFPWYEKGRKQAAQVALLYDDRAVYALFVCQDRHIFAKRTIPNSLVSRDSCVEFFATPDPFRNEYFNFETNCCGTMHLGFGRWRSKRRLADAKIFRSIRIATSVPTRTKQESPSDKLWWVAVRLPFAAISALAGQPVAPKSGSVWRVNFYRCGGRTDKQYACWNPICWRRPNYHRPRYFGMATFE